MIKALRDHYLRIDARSLGLFRLMFGAVLVYDLLRRWRWVKELYSNEGVLPNHNHLFLLREKETVWSALHAFSSPGEGHVAFAVILFFYVCLAVGYKARVFQALSLVALVSLTARNILLENAGNHAAIALLAFTLFLPLGSRFSLDSLLSSMDERDEKRAKELNDRRLPSEERVAAERRPGWSPASLAAFAVLAQIAVIYAVSWMKKTGAPWQDGSAFYYALNNERLVSGLGSTLRTLSPGGLGLLTKAFRYAEIAIPVLIAIPIGFRVTRTAAAVIALLHGLTLGVLFSFGLYGWTLAAASALLIPVEVWKAVEGVPRAKRRITVIYDADCGVCLWIARLIKRLDLRQNITFQGNDDLEVLLRRKDDGAIEHAPLPAEITQQLVTETVLAVDRDGRVHKRSRAISTILAALPLGWTVAWVMRVPGIVQLLDLLYDVIAARRQNISVLMGKEACGIDSGPHDDEGEGEEVAAGYREGPRKVAPDAGAVAIAPWTRTHRAITGLLRDLAVAVIFAAMLAQTAKVNDLPWSIPQGKVLAGVASWPRMIARWDVLAPAPPEVDEMFVIDAQTRGGKSVDPLTGQEPVFDPSKLRGTGLGQLWNDYLYRLHLKEWVDFQKAFRDYLAKSGPRWDGKVDQELISGLDAYWITQAIPAPGEPRSAEPTREKVFTHSRGGRGAHDRPLPLLRPDLNLNRR